MDWDMLFQTQQQLDQYIEENHGLQEKDLFNQKVMALLVELGELANETRCFKFWSQKPPSPEEVILEEYVDGLHFMLSLGLENGYRYKARQLEAHKDLTTGFLQVFGRVETFKVNPTTESYQEMFNEFLKLGAALGFTEEAIQSSYYQKNEQNHQRQDDGY